MRRPQILIADDDLAILKFLRANLKASDYDTLVATDGIEALQTIEKELPDLVILDIMMPKMDGLEVCRRLREWAQIPVIMLSARGDEADKVKCLDLGADDYITKPFGVEELLARVRAVFRRAKPLEKTPESAFHSGDLVVDFANHRATLSGKELYLTATEYRLLSYLARNAGRVVTHDQILEKVWGEEYIGEHHLVRVNIARLREKLGDDPKNPRFITTNTGIGYMVLKPH